MGYWAPLEGIKDPEKVLDYAKTADEIEFDSLAASSHFHPWRHTNTYATHVLPWLSVALERTEQIEVGTGVICPTFRYHPGELAQVFASMDHMYPGRVFLGVGTGERLNEVPLGYEWPSYKERKERLIEAVKIVRLLWSEDFASYDGNYYSLKDANLYTKPKTEPPIYVAAEGPKSAEMAGRYGDGLFTPLPPNEKLKEEVLPSFEKGAENEGKNPEDLEKAVETTISYHSDPEKALESCRHWGVTTLPGHIEKTHDPRQFEKFEEKVTDEQLKEAFKIATQPEEIISYIEKFLQLGFTKIFLHSTSPNEPKFLEVCEREIVPYFRDLWEK
ncbi:hypothetical protein AKJ39_00315 [candidate division MSBL1 archaeon SCGC-AAA259J03]|uniref:Luciferase-like domain-containing protein n=1 Tax=candidate division MSBL1 archaeon SCGC-AAA259J03 TaxID=1698269 RepID=A0A656Z041_9EURY|nr:hypothetical protein AKJ39_00315 [candidate division MSBL1 archaeon SCGC-AAA259J03]